ncbi:MAG: YfhO family protein, partial [Clostridia bacterium]|nr:YfhO family protein [Clostridia bacterium]
MKNLHSPKAADRTVPVTLALSFAMPFTVILILFAVSGIAPFGDYSLCSMDGFSQYYPMLMNMTEAVKKGELFYSFNGGLGFNLWAQSAYYTNSLLWLPLYFLPHSLQVSYIDLSVLLRLSLAGLFFCIRLVSLNKNTSYKRMLTVCPVISLVWALSGFMSAFINQFMWLDVVVFLPLVILGIEKIKEKKSPALYISVLFLSIVSCFYLSFMVCIFAVLWFMFIMLREKHSFKEFLSRAAVFFSSSLISGGMSAAVILPVYKALTLTKASELGFDGTLKINYTLKEFLLRLLPFQETSHAYKLPNIYCTATVIILFLFFLFSKKLTLRHRMASLVFVTFMYLTMSINLGEFIWHGFHYPNQLPARQSFLVIFLMVSLAA